MSKKLNHILYFDLSALSSGYNRAKAVEYAKTWAFKQNPKYASFVNMGGDCTNFVSQCLYAGGIKMNYQQYGWFYNNLNNRAPAWSGVKELYNFALNNNSSTGIKAILVTNFSDNQSNIAEIKNTEFNNSLQPIEIGDIVMLENEKGLYHSLLITKIKQPVTKQNIYVTGHDKDVLDIPLSSYLFKNFRILHVIN